MNGSRDRNQIPRFPAGIVGIVLGIWSLCALPAAVAFGSDSARLRPPVWTDQDDHPIPKPKTRNASELYAILYNSWLRFIDLESTFVAGPSLNVNAWDEVPSSSWFTNRIGLRELAFEEISGGIPGVPPAPGRWKVLRIRDEGYTPKIDIEDGNGNRYVLKFDVPHALERNSAAERMSTLIMHACGYNVPHNTIAYFTRSDLYPDADSYYRDSIGRRRPLKETDLDAALEKLTPMADGRYRGLASYFLTGEDVGKFFYSGIRKDDANDYIPHEFRRELRGLRVVASWVNHTDVKDVNAMDLFQEGDDGRGYVKHYFIDFGSTFGSGDFKNGPFRVGHEYLFDGAAAGKSFITLGAWERPWEVNGRIHYTEVGYFDSALFDPPTWKPNYPNLAFLSMDDQDAYWGAKIVTSFTDDLIRRLAREGDYSRPEVTDYVTRVLTERRNRIGEYWFGRITPLEQLTFVEEDGSFELAFENLAVNRGYWPGEGTLYRWWIQDRKGNLLMPPTSTFTGASYLLLPASTSLDPEDAGPADRWGRKELAVIYLQAKPPGSTSWALPVAVFVGLQNNSSDISVLGWIHGIDASPPR